MHPQQGQALRAGKVQNALEQLAEETCAVRFGADIGEIDVASLARLMKPSNERWVSPELTPIKLSDSYGCHAAARHYDATENLKSKLAVSAWILLFHVALNRAAVTSVVAGIAASTAFAASDVGNAATAGSFPAAGAAIGPERSGFVLPPEPGPRPFWQFAGFGSGIGGSNIVIGPANGSIAPEIVLGGQTDHHYARNDFWQVIRWNPDRQTYDQIFVSDIYSAAVQRILAANVIGDARQELVVMLGDGRIYLYDFASKAELGHVATGKTGLEALAVSDIAGDARSELIVTTRNDLFVFSGEGELLWELAGAGGYQVVCGQMDNDGPLEIATTNGYVVDAGSRTAQWIRGGTREYHLALAPHESASYQQLLIAHRIQTLSAYDVPTQTERWAIETPHEIGALRVIDVDNDGTPDLLFDQASYLYVRQLSTRSLKWFMHIIDRLVDVAVADVDADGRRELVWSSGWLSSAGDHLYVTNPETRALEWKSVDYTGGFLGPAIADLDGDGAQELVACSVHSESEYNNAHVLVFDLATLALRSTWRTTYGKVRDVELSDLDGDGRAEIVVAGEHGTGTAEAFAFHQDNTVTRTWTVHRAGQSRFDFVEVSDLEGDGAPEIVVNTKLKDANYSTDLALHAYDYPSVEPVRSEKLGGYYESASGLKVQDFDDSGDKEIAVLVSNGDLFTVHGPTLQVEARQQNTGFSLLNRSASPFGLIAGDLGGTGHFLRYANGRHVEIFSRRLAQGPLEGINESSPGMLWTGRGGVLTLRTPPYTNVTWQSPPSAAGVGRFVAVDDAGGARRVFTATHARLLGFTYSEPSFTLDILGMNLAGDDALITFSALAGRTFRLERKLHLHDATWESVTGVADLTVNHNGLAQFTDPGARTLGRAFYRVRMLP